jgi:hypothetical protein
MQITSRLARWLALGAKTSTKTGLWLALGAVVACDDAPPAEGAGDAAPDAAGVDAAVDVPDGAVDAAPDAAADASVDATVLTGTPRLNELDCRTPGGIELFAATPADLTGWQVVAQGRTVALSGILEQFQWVELPFALTCGRPVTLIDPAGTPADEATAELGPAAVTTGRLPDGDGAWQPTAPTPGAANQARTLPAADLLDGTLHPLALTLSAGAIEVLDREWEKDVEATLTWGGEARPVMVRISGLDGRARRVDQRTSLKIRYMDAQPGGLGGIELRPALPDPALLTEQVALSMLGSAGIAVPRAGFAQVSIDGLELGPFGVIEATDGAFADQHFASTWHVWQALRVDLHPDTTGELTPLVGDVFDRRDLFWLGARLPDDAPWGPTQDAVDWPATLRVLAAEAWLGSIEGYGPTGNLLKFHVNQEPRLTLLPDGLDVALRRPLNPQGGQGRLFQVCNQDPACRAAYEAALVEVHTAFAGGDWPARVRAQAAALRPAVAADAASFWSVSMFDDATEARARFIEARIAEVSEIIECLATDPDADQDGFRCAADCDPTDPQTFLGAEEFCGNGLDEDCSGVADDGPNCPRCTPLTRAGKRYLVCPQRRGYDSVRPLCEGLGARPVQIESAGENTWLFQQAQGVARQDYWLGLDDLATEGTFVRSDGTEPVFTAWAPGEPNNYNGVEDCAHLRTDGLWNDLDCAGRLGIICDFPCEFEDLDGDGATSCSEDCDDSNPDVRPGAVDVCGDGIDQDCSGVADDAGDCACATVLRGPHRYLLCPTGVAFDQIAPICAAQGLAPVRIDHASENAFVFAAARARRFQRWWLALSDQETEGQYRYVDGSPLTFAAWSRGEPNDSGRVEDCIHFWEDRAEWNDIGCGAHGGVICEAACAPGTDEDGDGAERCGADCDDGDAARHPGAVEACDEVDEDCDGRVDEGC